MTGTGRLLVALAALMAATSWGLTWALNLIVQPLAAPPPAAEQPRSTLDPPSQVRLVDDLPGRPAPRTQIPPAAPTVAVSPPSEENIVDLNLGVAAQLPVVDATVTIGVGGQAAEPDPDAEARAAWQARDDEMRTACVASGGTMAAAEYPTHQPCVPPAPPEPPPAEV